MCTSDKAWGALIIHLLRLHYLPYQYYAVLIMAANGMTLLTVMEYVPGWNLRASKTCNLLVSMYRSSIICCTSISRKLAYKNFLRRQVNRMKKSRLLCKAAKQGKLMDAAGNRGKEAMRSFVRLSNVHAQPSLDLLCASLTQGSRSTVRRNDNCLLRLLALIHGSQLPGPNLSCLMHCALLMH